LVNVLVVGSGGREHSIGWKLSQSAKVKTVFYAPGNGGTKNNLPILANEFDKLANFASEHECFTVVGPEVPLAGGIVDYFREKKLKIFGPDKNASRLETSKIWAKNFMKRNHIPTASFEIFEDPGSAIAFVKSANSNLVVKADGLAAGKGVIVCNSKAEAISAVESVMIKNSYGDAGNRIIIEERIDGVEASYIALSDGKNTYQMATSQDHKRIFEKDKGPNTGGMGAYSPTPVINNSLSNFIQEKIIDKTVNSMRQEGNLFQGFLYAGIMIKDSEPLVLEFNVRMGDPECQPIMMRMESDLFDYLYACSEKNLSSLGPILWKPQSAVCVVMTSKGYPESYPKNEKIQGLDSIGSEATVFHAGTKRIDDKIFTNGGRVLGVTSLGDSLDQAISKAYNAAEKILWPNKYFRRDIGKKGLNF